MSTSGTVWSKDVCFQRKLKFKQTLTQETSGQAYKFVISNTAVRPRRTCNWTVGQQPGKSTGQECVDGAEIRIEDTGMKLWEGRTRTEKDEDEVLDFVQFGSECRGMWNQEACPQGRDMEVRDDNETVPHLGVKDRKGEFIKELAGKTLVLKSDDEPAILTLQDDVSFCPMLSVYPKEFDGYGFRDGHRTCRHFKAHSDGSMAIQRTTDRRWGRSSVIFGERTLFNMASARLGLRRDSGPIQDWDDVGSVFGSTRMSCETLDSQVAKDLMQIMNPEFERKVQVAEELQE